MRLTTQGVNRLNPGLVCNLGCLGKKKKKNQRVTPPSWNCPTSALLEVRVQGHLRYPVRNTLGFLGFNISSVKATRLSIRKGEAGGEGEPSGNKW